MNIIFLRDGHGQSRARSMGARAVVLTVVLALSLVAALLAGAFWLGRQSAASDASITPELVKTWQENLKQQKEEIRTYKSLAQQNIDALTLRMGELQARLLRLDALGQRLTDVAGLDEGEFDFESSPALGGPEEPALEQSFSVPMLTQVLESIEQQAESREQQLRVMDELFVNQRFQREQFVAGRPIKKGWLSSHYGFRSDPFTGKRAWHSGVDFAGKEGSDIVAVAGGVVTHSEERFGYGNLVEVNHGGGLVTRYAHCAKLMVKTGDVVQKGQVLAKMGSTGRSTGPHVHFEVLQDGRSANPTKFIHRASR
ncbi:Membrane protein related to metalloendopeptidase [Hahella chejuensis KCTC 2396]|uniref:Membrane protein related to metalloendopeptidase n=1 Tax=Hahella chejuensis (strain KCTC 2396) TaxID=349521 RepID=Q2SA00_HAHCH|nr:M23 family metallopeptidase [Hahella chejuensis]ABC32524.1 Membrane protein related to metalloendopeptidase [Hahella chejuensis KCTC 2396]